MRSRVLHYLLSNIISISLDARVRDSEEDDLEDSSSEESFGKGWLFPSSEEMTSVIGLLSTRVTCISKDRYRDCLVHDEIRVEEVVFEELRG